MDFFIPSSEETRQERLQKNYERIAKLYHLPRKVDSASRIQKPVCPKKVAFNGGTVRVFERDDKVPEVEETEESEDEEEEPYVYRNGDKTFLSETLGSISGDVSESDSEDEEEEQIPQNYGMIRGVAVPYFNPLVNAVDLGKADEELLQYAQYSRFEKFDDPKDRDAAMREYIKDGSAKGSTSGRGQVTTLLHDKVLKTIKDTTKKGSKTRLKQLGAHAGTIIDVVFDKIMEFRRMEVLRERLHPTLVHYLDLSLEHDSSMAYWLVLNRWMSRHGNRIFVPESHVDPSWCRTLETDLCNAFP